MFQPSWQTRAYYDQIRSYKIIDTLQVIYEAGPNNKMGTGSMLRIEH